jgi:predicted TIM-barrel fold metal-dependent hydrolase
MFLRSAAAATAGSLATRQSPALPKLEKIIDAHVHFYDPFRPGGTPFPPKDDATLYRTVLPAEYRKMTAGYGIRGVIEVEASPLLEDNQWVLDLASREPIILGTCGDLEIGKAGFAKNLERFHKSRRFLGIRIGYLWGRNLHDDLQNPNAFANLKLLSRAGLEADFVGRPNEIDDVIEISDRVPELRIVIDHMPFDDPHDAAEKSAYDKALREIGDRPQIFSKVSSVLRRVDNRLVEDPDYYRPKLDELWGIFGADRLIYGSNWPVSDKVGPFAVVFNVVREYFAAKGEEASEKYFWKNSKVAYRWKS